MSAAAVNAGRVLLQNVTLAAEGVYKCEVSTEAPNFNTDYKESNLSIIGELTASQQALPPHLIVIAVQMNSLRASN